MVRADGGSSDGGSVDAGPLVDAQAQDAGEPVDASADAGPRPDAGPLCGDMMAGRCEDSALSCLSCPSGPITEHHLCTTRCATDGDCTDPARPSCNRPEVGIGGSPMGICTSGRFSCAWGAMCASPDTLIATPTGERPIAELLPGDLVYSLVEGRLAEVPIAQIGRTPVSGHRVVRVTLASGAHIEMSEGHPTADGRFFADLAPGDYMDGVPVLSVELIPYLYSHTYDILPDSAGGTYVAAGVLVGSSLAAGR